MSIFGRRKKLSPFDSPEEDRQTPVRKLSVSSQDDGRGFEVRNMVFLGGLLISLNLGFVYSSHRMINFCGIMIIVLVWALILRFIESRKVRVLNVILNMSVGAAMYLIPGTPFDGRDLASFIPVIAGVTIQSSFNSDDSGLFRRPQFINEVIIPMTGGIFAYSLSAALCYTSDIRSLALGVFLSSIMLTIMSYVITKITGRGFAFTSLRLSDTSDIALSDREGKRFYISVALYKGVILLICEILMFSCENEFFIKGLVFTEGNRQILMKVFAVILLDAAAALLSGVYKRRSITVKKYRYFRGFPLIMIMVSLIMMFLEIIIR